MFVTHTAARLLPAALLPMALLATVALSMTACTETVSEQSAPAAQWSCSPDAESRYHIGPDGMTLEVCSAGCADHAEGAVCGG